MNLIHNILPKHLKEIVFVFPDTTVKQCANLMVRHGIGAVLVMDDEHLIGVVSERDITRQCVHKSLDPKQACAMDIAYAHADILSEHDSIDEAMQVMIASKRRHILIQDDFGKIIAIVSIGDLLLSQLSHCSHTIEQLEHYIRAS